MRGAERQLREGLVVEVVFSFFDISTRTNKDTVYNGVDANKNRTMEDNSRPDLPGRLITLGSLQF